LGAVEVLDKVLTCNGFPAFGRVQSEGGVMAYNTRHVMNTILQRSFRERRGDMSPMKAQKLLFFTHGGILLRLDIRRSINRSKYGHMALSLSKYIMI
jgi:hypothetical protein